MEKIALLITTTRNALSTLQSILEESPSDIIRDATIQRFEYCTDLVWKVLQVYHASEGILCNSPKGCFRQALQTGLITPEDVIIGLSMIDDRNLTSHIYREEVASEIFQKIPGYYLCMIRVITAVETAVATR